MGWTLTLGTKTIKILGSYIKDRMKYFVTPHKSSGKSSFKPTTSKALTTNIIVFYYFSPPKHNFNLIHMLG